MKYKVFLKEGVGEEVKEAMAWYDSQQQGVGKRFGNTFAKAKILLAKMPKIYRINEDDFRRMPIKPFDFSIYYEVIDEKKEVWIWAIWHNKRDDWWKTKIKN